jgi:RecJ-like exonuclease
MRILYLMSKTNFAPCPRCLGTGSWCRVGRCFRCLGTGRVLTAAGRAAARKAAREDIEARIRLEHAGINVFEGNCTL